MSEMMERLTSALCKAKDADGDHLSWSPGSFWTREAAAEALARALLAELREPTEAQIRAVDAALHKHWPSARKMAVAMQQAMIDAALAPPPIAERAGME